MNYLQLDKCNVLKVQWPCKESFPYKDLSTLLQSIFLQDCRLNQRLHICSQSFFAVQLSSVLWYTVVHYRVCHCQNTDLPVADPDSWSCICSAFCHSCSGHPCPFISVTCNSLLLVISLLHDKIRTGHSTV